MFIYLVERTDGHTWDDFDSFVCIAENEETALKIAPTYDTQQPATFWDVNDTLSSWVTNEADLKVTLIGIAVEGSARMAVCSSFNAG